MTRHMHPGGIGRLLQITVDTAGLSWMDQARCQETDAEAFFPEKGAPARLAKTVCQGCEVRAECLEYALETSQRHGVWGGFSERQRRSMSAGRRAA